MPICTWKSFGFLITNEFIVFMKAIYQNLYVWDSIPFETEWRFIRPIRISKKWYTTCVRTIIPLHSPSFKKIIFTPGKTALWKALNIAIYPFKIIDFTQCEVYYFCLFYYKENIFRFLKNIFIFVLTFYQS